MLAMIVNILRDQRGATAVEYGLIAGVLGLGLVVGMNAFTNAFRNLYMVVDHQTINAISRY